MENSFRLSVHILESSNPTTGPMFIERNLYGVKMPAKIFFNFLELYSIRKMSFSRLTLKNGLFHLPMDALAPWTPTNVSPPEYIQN